MLKILFSVMSVNIDVFCHMNQIFSLLRKIVWFSHPLKFSHTLVVAWGPPALRLILGV